MKALQIINTAYRATMEEQDDTIVWLCQAMKGAGADLDVLLCGNAVNYAISTQNAEGLSFGDWQQTEPPQLARDISSLIAKNLTVYLVKEDLYFRGIGKDEIVDGVQHIARSDVGELFERYDQVWRW